MKIFRYIIAFAALALAAVSCNLNEKSFTEIDKGSYMNDAAEAQTVLLGVYRDMEADGMYGFYYSLYYTLPSDEAKVEGSSLNNFRAVPSNAYSSSDSYIQGGWQKMYSSIYDATNFIETATERMKNFSDEDKKITEIYIAEARVLRSLFYFELVRWFGNIVLMKSTAESNQHPSTFVQTPAAEVYAWIENELKEAIEVLPYESDDAVRVDTRFRISKGGALGLLTKVYATWAGYPLRDESKWELAAETARTLIYSGKHELVANFEDLWKNVANNVWEPRESLIEVSFYSQKYTQQASQDASGRIGKWNGVTAASGAVPCVAVAANWRVVPMFARDWKDNANDKRWAISFADYKYTAKGKEPLNANATLVDAIQEGSTESIRKPFNGNVTPGKFDICKYTNAENILTAQHFSNTNWYILRYADVLLLYAEALNEANHGPNAEAYEAVNMVRRRGYGLDINFASAAADLPDGLGYEDFQKAVRDERSYELCFEGHRRQDLIRWGIYYETIRETYINYSTWHSDAPDLYQAGIYTIKGKNELLPIPLRELDLCPQLEQNENW